MPAEAKEWSRASKKSMLHDRFPDYEGRIAVGLAGHGSQCFGYDDALSRDHDFAPGFCLWLTDADDARIGAALAQAYRALPAPDPAARSVQGENTSGVRRTLFFYSRYTGSQGLPEGNLHWLSIPSWALAEATNGAVFRDDLGEFTRMREVLLHGMPEDVRLKKLAARCASMSRFAVINLYHQPAEKSMYPHGGGRGRPLPKKPRDANLRCRYTRRRPARPRSRPPPRW